MFRIGEFSRIAQVSGRLLRYYDEINLLTPEFTDAQTGYRYYSAHQLARLNRILVLKALGLSLDQVARLLEHDVSAEEIRGMLTLRKAQIERTVQEEMSQVRDIESRLNQLDSHGQIQAPDVILRSVPAQTYLAVRDVLAGMDAVRRLVEQIYAVVPASVGPHNLGPIAILNHSLVFDPESLDFEVGYLLTGKAPHSVKLSEDRTLTIRELPAMAAMATFAHVGRVADSHNSYRALAYWLEANAYQFDGPGREIMMQLPLSGKEAQAVIEIQLPVTKVDRPMPFS